MASKLILRYLAVTKQIKSGSLHRKHVTFNTIELIANFLSFTAVLFFLASPELAKFFLDLNTNIIIMAVRILFRRTVIEIELIKLFIDIIYRYNYRLNLS